MGWKGSFYRKKRFMFRTLKMRERVNVMRWFVAIVEGYEGRATRPGPR